MQRLPVLQDFNYLLDPGFILNSAAGFHISFPVYATAFTIFSCCAIGVPTSEVRWGKLITGLVASCLIFGLHHFVSTADSRQGIAARYNSLHWMIAGSLFLPDRDDREYSTVDLPQSLRVVDLDGKKLIGSGTARNVLIVALEGISGLYLPEMREWAGVDSDIYRMDKLARAIPDAMLIPDFVDHSHQTIRGLYSLHCGDFSKLSFDMPKALELLAHPQRAGQCLPAQLRQNGWESHYLQGAGLQFMNKEKAMPAMGFDQVHGVEWFTERVHHDFHWGTTDDDFFLGARKYVSGLQQQGKPWFLSLLTVGTHQPFGVSDELAEKYGSRKIASVARLDEAVSEFINGLREDGVLEDTLVLITSDESHGGEGAGWHSSWGMAVILAPERDRLPRIKKGTYGLVDVEASILDYLGLPLPQSLLGRSFFRDYGTGREMVSYSASKLRWQTAENDLYECGRDGNCLKMTGQALIGLRRENNATRSDTSAPRLFGLAAVLDNGLRQNFDKQVLQFASGEVRVLPEKIKNEWTDNLVGAQYLAFPKDSTVHVDIQLKAVATGPQGVQMKMKLRQFEQEVQSINYPLFPLLRTGEGCRVQFAFDNSEARQAFSFHVVGEGKDAKIRFDKFEITIEQHKS